MYMPGNYKWGKRNTGRQKIGTGGKEKASLQYNCHIKKQENIQDLSPNGNLHTLQYIGNPEGTQFTMK